jgi:hypothetical protein
LRLLSVELGHRSVEADLESFNLAEPAVASGLANTFTEVLDDLDQPGPLAGISLEDGATA